MKMYFTCSETTAAIKKRRALVKHYGQVPHLDDAEVVVPIGGDGHMLDMLGMIADRNISAPVFGLNMGTVGYAMNDLSKGCLVERIEQAETQVIRPIRAIIERENGKPSEIIGWNEGTVFRQSLQTLRVSVSVNDDLKITDITCDGLIYATPFGSTAYNRSAGGPILPLESKSNVLTPICPHRPRDWPGAVLPFRVGVTIQNLDPHKRPMVVTADGNHVSNVERVTFTTSPRKKATLLFDPDHGLSERILREQFPFS
jgi:NAD+ kinase